MDRRGTSARRSVDLDVPARVAYERMCRIEEYPLFRSLVRRVTALSETTHRWEVAGTALTTHLDERRPGRMLRWHSVDGPACTETVLVQALSPRRSRLTVETSGPPDLAAGLGVDLDTFKRHVERDHPPVGHHGNERPVVDGRHRSNWRDGLLSRRTDSGRR